MGSTVVEEEMETLVDEDLCYMHRRLNFFRLRQSHTTQMYCMRTRVQNDRDTAFGRGVTIPPVIESRMAKASLCIAVRLESSLSSRVRSASEQAVLVLVCGSRRSLLPAA